MRLSGCRNLSDGSPCFLSLVVLEVIETDFSAIEIFGSKINALFAMGLTGLSYESMRDFFL